MNKQDVRLRIIDTVLDGKRLYEGCRTFYDTNNVRVRERIIYDDDKSLFRWKDIGYMPDPNLDYAGRPISFTEASTLLDLHWERRNIPGELSASFRERHHPSKYGKWSH